ncbi:MAG: hypothetical protein ACO1OB_20495 [Archangium sp.]
MALPFAARWEVSSLRWNHGSFVEAAQVKPLVGQSAGDWWVERPMQDLPPRHLARVQRRWWLASKLTSPVWPSLIDAGEDGGTPWAVIESPGRRTDGTFPFADALLAVRAARHLAHGVAEAEALLLSLGTSPHLSLNASVLGRDDAGQLRLHLAALDVTPDEGFPGSPAVWLWTPELLNGQPQNARSNVYALAWLLHLMLTGRSPYGAFAQGRSESQAREALKPLVHAQKFSFSLPTAAAKVEPILKRALSANPAQRFPNAAAFAEALAALVPGAPATRLSVQLTLDTPAFDPQYEALPPALEARLINAPDDAPVWNELVQLLEAVKSPRARALKGDASTHAELAPPPNAETLQLTWKRGYVRALTVTGGEGRVNEITAFLLHPSLRFLNELTLRGSATHTQGWLEALGRSAPPALKRVTVKAIGARDPAAVDLAFRYPKWTWVWGEEKGLLSRLFGR